jgi:hypothetical protein
MPREPRQKPPLLMMLQPPLLPMRSRRLRASGLVDRRGGVGRWEADDLVEEADFEGRDLGAG